MRYIQLSANMCVCFSGPNIWATLPRDEGIPLYGVGDVPGPSSNKKFNPNRGYMNTRGRIYG